MIGTVHQAAQALLVEVTKTAAKYQAISSWTTAVKSPGGGKNRNRSECLKDIGAASARQDRVTLLRTQKVPHDSGYVMDAPLF